MIFLYAPIAVLIIYSFNSGKGNVWQGFSLKWYGELFRDRAIMKATANTLIIALCASVISTIIGTVAAIGIHNYKGFKKKVMMNVSNIPIINPEIVTAVSLMFLFVFVGRIFNFEMGEVTVLLAHISFCVPYVLLNILPKLRQMDRHIFEAALDLGCNQRQAFFKVVVPEIIPGIVSGFLMAFTFSLDDYIITFFTRGSSFQTLPILIGSMLRKRVVPTINALSTILFLITLSVLLIINFKDIKKSKKENLK